MEGTEDDTDTPSQSTEESHAEPVKVETPLENLNDTAAAPPAVPPNTDLHGPPSESELKIASLEARIRALEAELESQRRQDPYQPFFYTPPRGLQKEDRPLPLLKWLLKRGERMKELDQLSEVYSSTHQVENIMAAKAYHAQLPADEYVPSGTISFAEGKIVDGNSDLSKMKGPAWFEVCQEYESNSQ